MRRPATSSPSAYHPSPLKSSNLHSQCGRVVLHCHYIWILACPARWVYREYSPNIRRKGRVQGAKIHRGGELNNRNKADMHIQGSGATPRRTSPLKMRSSPIPQQRRARPFVADLRFTAAEQPALVSPAKIPAALPDSSALPRRPSILMSGLRGDTHPACRPCPLC